jgi:hypothetical protein
MKRYERIRCLGDMVLHNLNQLEKKYCGLTVISIVPATDLSIGGYHIFFSYEDLRTNQCERNEEDQEQDQ